jgi:hypothetical protein
MNVLGHFLELSIYTPDIQTSLGFYKRLGFAEQRIGDIWPHKYAVVSDGDMCIGLHDRVFDSPALTFVHHDIARCARSMSDHGFDFSFLRLDEDVFNELGFSDSDGHTVSMIEARTFTPPDENAPDSSCGSCFEVSLPVRDALHAGRFWAPLAPNLLSLREEPTTHMRFDAGGTPLGLSESIALKRPSLCFRCDDKDALMDVIEQHGLNSKPFPGYEGAFVEIVAPEGTTLYAFSEDFLGEPYEVDESNDAPGAELTQ